ncbi:uncharacterized protein LOC130892238 isoform X2 [Diorhabda carinulata]|uniref:uncharacterized protein LOC130892238 isoform X2 n=1 Tax=Diorhabda carinulata TaxID=1163345 RepID=UPI0025A2DE6E|nr:uncharacterized protein LOC130892238 isoform X2 [Diorhabda carinulata]
MPTESDSSVSSDEIDWLGENCGVYEDIVECLIETTDEKPQSPVVCVNTDNDNNNHIAENYLTNKAKSPPKNKRSAEDEKTVAQNKGKREGSYKFW